MKEMHELYPDTPCIALYDPLAHLLGAGEGYLIYRFWDAVKLSGHACPTVAGAFLMTLHALKALFEEQTPVRGEVKITVPGPADHGVNGPTSQVMTLITGAAADNGFHGLNGRFSRHGLMRFSNRPDDPFVFERSDSDRCVAVRYDPSAIPADPEMNELMPAVMSGRADATTQARFAELWRQRVIAILEDDGRSTITFIHPD